MRFNPHKTVSASSKGVIISFRDVNKHKFIVYESKGLERTQTSHKTTQELDTPVFNKLQQTMYAEVVYGLSFYSTKDVDQMPKHKKQTILSRYAKAQRILNRWKQEIVFEKVDSFLLAFFPNSPITKALVDTKGYDRQTRETHSFKELGLSQTDVARKLIEVNLLPKNFFELA